MKYFNSQMVYQSKPSFKIQLIFFCMQFCAYSFCFEILKMISFHPQMVLKPNSLWKIIFFYYILNYSISNFTLKWRIYQKNVKKFKFLFFEYKFKSLIIILKREKIILIHTQMVYQSKPSFKMQLIFFFMQFCA